MVAFWVLLQVADIILPAVNAPAWSMTVLIAAGLLGVPVAAVASYIWDLTPEGIQRTDDHDIDAPVPELHLAPRWIDYVIIAALLVVLAIVLLRPDPPRTGAVGQSVAVLPFRDLSPSQDSRYLADGLAESIMDRLARVPGVVVSARTSAFSYRDTDLDARTVAQELGVDTLLEGSVQKAGERLRVTARLVDGASGRQVWGDHFDTRVEEVFEIQDRIAESITSMMQVQVGSSAETGLETDDAEAYDRYLRGRSLLRQREDLEQIEAALDHFESALEVDPGFALAAAGRCSAMWERYERVRRLEYAEAALDYCRVVESKHGRRAETQIAMANLRLGTGQPRLARDAFREALTRDPHNAEAHAGLAAALRDLGDLPAAAEELRVAISLDPAYWRHRWQLGVVHFLSGRHDEAIAALGEAIRLNPEASDPFVALGGVRFMRGEFLPAADAFEKAIRIDPNDARAFSNAGTTYFYLGELSRAEAMFRRATELVAADSRWTGFLAWAIRLQPDRDGDAEPWHRATIRTSTERLAINENDDEARAALAVHLAALDFQTAARGALSSLPAIEELAVNAMMMAGFAHFYLDEPEQAAAIFETALARGLPPFMLYRDPRLRDAWSHPAFARLQQQVPALAPTSPTEGVQQ
ncbi:MAG: tetratricopeptide repeat protein [Wenzhouxiangellaceae bacterium]|nr:tetratricopeptide repeat protein [Wenzhouxiangellaceae bacterium]